MRASIVLLAMAAMIGLINLMQPPAQHDPRLTVTNFVARLAQQDWPGAYRLVETPPKFFATEQWPQVDWLRNLSEAGQWASATQLLGQIEATRIMQSPATGQIMALATGEGYIALRSHRDGWKIVACRRTNLPASHWPHEQLEWVGFEHGQFILRDQGVYRPMVASDLGATPLTPSVKPEPDKIAVPDPQPPVKDPQSPDTTQVKPPVTPVAIPPVTPEPPKPKKLFLQIGYSVMHELGSQQPIALLRNLANQDTTLIRDQETSIMPGKYELTISEDGYDQCLEPVDVPVNEEQIFYFRYTLQATPRKFSVLLRLNDNAQTEPDQILLNGEPLLAHKPVKPGQYELQISKEGYETIREKISILANLQEFKLVRQLTAATREVLVTILDKESGQRLIADQLELDSSKQSAEAALSLVPGAHEVLVTIKGYRPLAQSITIPAGSGPYRLTLFMEAVKPAAVPTTNSQRGLIFLFVNDAGAIVVPLATSVNGKPYQPVNTYPVNSTVKVMATFAEYQTYLADLAVESGDGPLEVKSVLTSLQKRQVRLPAALTALDALETPYEFLADSRPIESQHAQIVRDGELLDASIKLPATTKNLRIVVAYWYGDYAVDKLPTEIREFEKISLDDWKNHFETMFRRVGKDAAVEAIVQFFNDAVNLKKLKASADSVEIKELVLYMQDWPVPPQILSGLEQRILEADK